VRYGSCGLHVFGVKPDTWCTVQAHSFGGVFFLGGGGLAGAAKKILGTLTDEVVAEIANGNDSDISFV